MTRPRSLRKTATDVLSHGNDYNYGMNHKQFISVIGALFVSVVLLSVLWEFYLEDVIGNTYFAYHHTESLPERLEYVITVCLFIAVSLVFPTLFGIRSIGRHVKLIENLKRSANEDYLTGLYNRRKIARELSKELGRSERYGRSFSIILVDIDDFKETNDTYGHNSGDAVLIKFAGIINKAVRDSDLTGRWGGEEFLVICPETDMNGAIALAEKIRSVVESSEFINTGKITASFGVTAYSDDEDIRSLIKRADDALYTAKNNGKNRVEIWTA